MQNKANLLDIQMNISYVKTKNYEQKTTEEESTKQSQTKPIELAFIGERRPAEALAKAGLSQPLISSTSAAFGQRELFVVAPGAGREEVVRHFVGRDFGLDGHRGVNVETAF